MRPPCFWPRDLKPQPSLTTRQGERLFLIAMAPESQVWASAPPGLLQDGGLGTPPRRAVWQKTVRGRLEGRPCPIHASTQGDSVRVGGHSRGSGRMLVSARSSGGRFHGYIGWGAGHPLWPWGGEGPTAGPGGAGGSWVVTATSLVITKASASAPTGRLLGGPSPGVRPLPPSWTQAEVAGDRASL